MLFRTLSASVVGIESRLIEVEVDSSPAPSGDPRYSTVGLPDAAVRESRERLRAAMRNCGFDLPLANVVINLAPADVRKEGSGFDLPMALALLGCWGAVSSARGSRNGHRNGQGRYGIDDFLFVGELALDGSLRPIRGSLPIAIMARERGIPRLVVPAANAAEAAVVQGVAVYGARDLPEVVAWVNRQAEPTPLRVDTAALLQQAQAGGALSVGGILMARMAAAARADREAAARWESWRRYKGESRRELGMPDDTTLRAPLVAE